MTHHRILSALTNHLCLEITNKCINSYQFIISLSYSYMFWHLCASAGFPVTVLYVYCGIEKNEIGRACGTYGGAERCAQGVGGDTRGKEAIGETKT
jgi:hypothetical protein